MCNTKEFQRQYTQKQNQASQKSPLLVEQLSVSLVKLHFFVTHAVMAFRLMGTLRSIMGRFKGNATYATSTTAKTKAYATDYVHFEDHHQPRKLERAFKGDFVPVYVATGMIALSMLLGVYTAKQQLCYSPNVRVRKKTRETLPEVEYPEKVVEEADKFFNKSFFRKVAHVQEFEYGDNPRPDPIREDVYAYKPHIETLQSVGVDPKLPIAVERIKSVGVDPKVK